jgi:RNA polymerase sigma-70 factor (ECF subfamily)
MIVYDREVSLETPAYFVAIAFDGDRVVSVHDFLYARYAIDGIDLFLLYPEYKARLYVGFVADR